MSPNCFVHTGHSPAYSARVLTSLLLIVLMPLSVWATPWQGESRVIDGVTHVINPVEPMEPGEIWELQELWRLGGDSDDEDQFFGLIIDLLVDQEGRLYLLDQVLNQIKIFSSDGEYLRAIGREGEGPGEFRRASGMVFLDELVGVFSDSPSRIATLTRQGVPRDDYPLPRVEGVDFVMISRGVSDGSRPCLTIGYNQFAEGSYTQQRRIVRSNQLGEIQKVLISGERGIDFSKPLFRERVWDDFQNRWDMDGSGRVYVAGNWGEYRIEAWSADDELRHVITRDLPSRRRTAGELDRLRLVYEPSIRRVPGATVDVETDDHPIITVHARDDGTLWVLNCHGGFDRPQGSLGKFDIFNSDGRLEREITLLGEGEPLADGYYFEGDRLFVVRGQMDAEAAAEGGLETEVAGREAEPMTVICYRLSP